MNTYKIGVIPGDGIGPQVVADTLEVLRAFGADVDTEIFDLGAARYLRDGHVLDEADLNALRKCDAILKGPMGPPIGSTEVPLGTVERGVVLRIRNEFDQYINFRPFTGRGLDFVIVRENTEGMYSGEGGIVHGGTPREVASQGSINTWTAVERCVRFAFEHAMARPRRHLTLVHKTNVLTYAGALWQRAFAHVAADFPDVETAYNHVDASCIYLHEDPQRYDVIVTDNLFGDIITDLAGAVVGGVGYVGTANLNPTGGAPSMFEPVHGSAHDSVGTDRVNPCSQIGSAILMMEHLGQPAVAEGMRNAMMSAIADGTKPGEIASRMIRATS